jgi:hypothetical protein
MPKTEICTILLSSPQQALKSDHLNSTQVNMTGTQRFKVFQAKMVMVSCAYRHLGIHKLKPDIRKLKILHSCIVSQWIIHITCFNQVCLVWMVTKCVLTCLYSHLVLFLFASLFIIVVCLSITLICVACFV